MALPNQSQSLPRADPPLLRQDLFLKGFDPDKLRGIVKDARFEHYILTNSPCEVRHRRWSCGSFSVDAGVYSFSTRVMGAFPRNRICIGYMRGMTEPTWSSGMVLGTHSIQFYPAGSELNYRAGRNAHWVAIEFEEDDLQKVAEERLGHPLVLPVGNVCDIPVSHAVVANLDRLVEKSMTPHATSARWVSPILAALVDTLEHAWKGTLTTIRKRWKHREVLLRKADEYLRAHVGAPFDSKALASFVGTTERSLQLHFHDAFGMTPGQWARCLALHRVRSQLLEIGAVRFSIEGIARDCGFRHMGRFASYYHELFGELPSDTLQRRMDAGTIQVLPHGAGEDEEPAERATRERGE